MGVKVTHRLFAPILTSPACEGRDIWLCKGFRKQESRIPVVVDDRPLLPQGWSVAVLFAITNTPREYRTEGATCPGVSAVK